MFFVVFYLCCWIIFAHIAQLTFHKVNQIFLQTFRRINLKSTCQPLLAVVYLSRRKGKGHGNPNGMTLRSKPDCRLHDQNNPLLEGKRLPLSRDHWWSVLLARKRERKQEGKGNALLPFLENLISKAQLGVAKHISSCFWRVAARQDWDTLAGNSKRITVAFARRLQINAQRLSHRIDAIRAAAALAWERGKEESDYLVQKSMSGA